MNQFAKNRNFSKYFIKKIKYLKNVIFDKGSGRIPKMRFANKNVLIIMFFRISLCGPKIQIGNILFCGTGTNRISGARLYVDNSSFTVILKYYE